MTALPPQRRVLNILHVIDSGGLYGAEQVLLTLAEKQQEAGHRVTIGTIREPGEAECALEHAAALHGLQTMVFRIGWGISLAGARAIYRYAIDGSVDVIHSHGYKANVMLCVVSHDRPPALVTTIHGWNASSPMSKLWLYEWLDRRVLTRMDAVVAVSKEMAVRFGLADRLGSRLHVVHNGLAESPVREEVAPVRRAIVEFCKRAFTVAVIGRLSQEKGVDVLLNALALLNDRGRPVQALIIGEGPDRDALVRQADAAGLSSTVLFAGYVADAATCLSSVSAYVLPSRSEGLPIVLLEAARAAIPIVSTAVGGVPEVIQHERSGILCASEDAVALADGIDRVRTDGEMAACLGEAAQRRFERTFTATAMVYGYSQVYESVTSQVYPSSR